MIIGHSKAAAVAWFGLLTGSADSDFVRVASLTGAGLFFVLKLLNVRWLRFRTDRRSLIALCLVLALVHSASLGFTSTGEFAPQLLATVTAAFFLDPIQRRLERFHDWLVRGSVASAAARQVCSSGRSAYAPIVLMPQFLVPRTLASPRAPPA